MPVFASIWNSELQWDGKSGDAPLYSVIKHTPLTYTSRRNSEIKSSREVLRARTEINCKPYNVLYDYKVSFPRGIQIVQFNTSDIKLLPSIGFYTDTQVYQDATGAGHYPWGPRSPSTDTQALEDWNHLMRIIFPLYNQWTLLQTLGLPLQDEVYMSNLVWRLKLDDSWCNKSSSSLINGTEFFDCLSWDLSSFSGWNTSSSLQGTVFDTSLNMPYTDQDPLDPRTDINVTEDLLNSVSTNITICLVAAITFAAIAIWSLSRNGTPAADGGFLQIMTATRGNAEMERLVLREKLTAVEDMSVELKALKVRYGELVGEDVVGVDGRTVGFGTIEETISLRKRK